MKIRIRDWAKFERATSSHITRDVNISNIQEVLGCFYFRDRHLFKRTYFAYIVLLDLYYDYNKESTRSISICPVVDSENIEVIDNTFSNVAFCKKKKMKLVYDDGIVTISKVVFTNIIAPKWMIDHPTFLLLQFVSEFDATKIYNEHRKQGELKEKWAY
ncbi:hypothetical protein J6Y73_00455 [bacterium]|nr:hypothetical protein [bacterium]